MTLRRASANAVGSIGLVLLALTACHRRNQDERQNTSASAALVTSAPVPLDHLRPGELAESPQQVFGFPIPRGMSIDRVFPDAAHLFGEVNVGELAEYVRKHAQVSAPELVPPLLRFDHARIPGQGEQRQYRFDITQNGRRVQMVVKDVTPAPTPPGLTEQERWKQAGLKPDGSPLNISDLR